MAVWLLNLDVADTAAAPDELASLDVLLDAPTVSSDSAADPDELASLDVSQDAPSVSSDSSAAPDELGALAVAQDSPTLSSDTAASPDELAAVDVAHDNPTLDAGTAAAPDELGALAVAQDDPTASADSAASPDELGSLDVVQDQPTADFAGTVAPDELGSLDVALDAPDLDPAQQSIPDALGLDLTVEAPDVAPTDTAATPDELAVPVALDDPIAGEFDGAFPSDDVSIDVASDDPTVTFGAGVFPDSLLLDVASDDPQGDATTVAGPDGAGVDLTLDAPTAKYAVFPDGLALDVASDDTTVAFTGTAVPTSATTPITLDPPSTTTLTATTVGDGPALPVSGPDPVTASFGMLVIPPDTFTVPITLTAPTFSFKSSDTSATPDSLVVQVTPGNPGQPVTGAVEPVVPIARAEAAPALAMHVLGIGPWNSATPWQGAPNWGIKAGRMVSAPVLALPLADSKSVTLRLGDAGEASTTHYFSRRSAILIQENVTDLWWRRKDPRRGTFDALGRYNATTVDVSVQSDGGAQVSATYTDYQGLLQDRMIMSYLNPGHTPPDTQWAAGTYITDILLWAIPTNMGLDLTGIQTASRDITAKLKAAFHLPLGTTIADAMKNLLVLSDAPWEWWVEMPDSDLDRPRLRLASARGADRGVVLFDIGGIGPIESWSVQRSGDKYANALLFMGDNGGVIRDYPDQIEIYGQRDAFLQDPTITDAVDGTGQPYHVIAAADAKLAQLASNMPSYQIVLRQGFWEGREHIDVGDWVGIRLELGASVIIEKYRVSELKVEIDGAGLETVTLTLGTPRPSKDPRSRNNSTAKLVRYLVKYQAPPGAVS